MHAYRFLACYYGNQGMLHNKPDDVSQYEGDNKVTMNDVS